MSRMLGSSLAGSTITLFDSIKVIRHMRSRSCEAALKTAVLKSTMINDN